MLHFSSPKHCSTDNFCYIKNGIKFKIYKRARGQMTALLFVRTPLWSKYGFLLDCLLSLRNCFHSHFLISFYGPRCWQRGAIPQKRHFGVGSDVLCGVVLLKQQTHMWPVVTCFVDQVRYDFISLQLKLSTLILTRSRFICSYSSVSSVSPQ